MEKGTVYGADSLHNVNMRRSYCRKGTRWAAACPYSHVCFPHQQHHDYISYLWTSYAQNNPPPPTHPLSKVLNCEMAQHYNITQIETLPCHAMQQR